MATKCLIAIVLLLGFTAVDAKRCYGLSMEGGGTHGAYEAGILYSFAHNMPPDEIQWNVISGISTGSINAGQCAQFPMGNETEMADWLIATWELIQNQDMIAPPWPGSVANAVFNRPSLFNTENFRTFMNGRCGDTINRNVTFGTTDLVTGAFTDFTQDVGAENIVTALMCSAAPPVAFPPIQFQDSWYVDGGITDNLDGFEAIKYCLDLGYSESEITVDLLFDDIINGIGLYKSNSTREVIARVNNITAYIDTNWFVSQLPVTYPEVEYRFVIHPSKGLPPFNSSAPGPALDFSP